MTHCLGYKKELANKSNGSRTAKWISLSVNGRVAVYKKESLPWPESEGAGKWRDISGEVSAKFKFHSFSLEKYCYVWSMDWFRKKVYLETAGQLQGAPRAGSYQCSPCKHYKEIILNPEPQPCSLDISWPLSFKYSFWNSWFHFHNFSIINFSVSATKTRSSIYNNSIGKPSLNSLFETFNIMINSNWLSLDAPHSNTEPLISLPFTFTAVLASSYLVFITDSTYPFIHTRTSQS